VELNAFLQHTHTRKYARTQTQTHTHSTKGRTFRQTVKNMTPLDKLTHTCTETPESFVHFVYSTAEGSWLAGCCQ